MANDFMIKSHYFWVTRISIMKMFKGKIWLEVPQVIRKMEKKIPAWQPFKKEEQSNIISTKETWQEYLL